MPTVAEWSRRTYPAPLGAGGVGSIPANSDTQNVPSFRLWRFEMKLSPFAAATAAAAAAAAAIAAAAAAVAVLAARGAAAGHDP